MKVRDSGMPDEKTWNGFFDACHILSLLDFSDPTTSVADFGCGYGTFSLAAAQATTGLVYAMDIEQAMVETTQSKAASLGQKNIKTIQCDFVKEGTGLPDNAIGYAMLFNILHAENPIGLLKEAYRILKPNGTVAIIHWRCDAPTPRGPDTSIRPTPEQCQRWATQAGFELNSPVISLPPHHYGMIGLKNPH